MHSEYRMSRRVVSTVVQIEANTKDDPKVDIGAVMTTDMAEEDTNPPHVLIAMRLVMYHNFSPSRACFVPIFIVLNM
jgi:hypothetical protein